MQEVFNAYTKFLNAVNSASMELMQELYLINASNYNKNGAENMDKHSEINNNMFKMYQENLNTFMHNANKNWQKYMPNFLGKNG